LQGKTYCIFNVFSQLAPDVTSYKHITVGKHHLLTWYQEIKRKG